MNVCAKVGNPDETDKFLERQKQLQLTQEETGNPNRPDSSDGDSPISEKFWNVPQREAQAQITDFTGWFYQTFKEELIPVLHKLIQKIEEEEIFFQLILWSQ